MARLPRVPVRDVRVGHYVVLDGSWTDHPFWRSRFLVESPGDLQRLRKAGLAEVAVDPDRSRVPLPGALALASLLSVEPDSPADEAPPEPEAPRVWEPERLAGAEFRELVRTTHLPAQVKAQKLHHAAVDVMADLMRRPTLERVQEFKADLAGLVDEVLRDAALAQGLLRITAHDFYTWTHSVNVGVLSLLLARHLYQGSDDHDLPELAAGFFLHDLGKAEVDSALLNKRGRFTEEERAAMRQHVPAGERMVRELGNLGPDVSAIVGQHHERPDGSGYPLGLTGGDIHPHAQICGIVDVYDALTALRPYKVSLGTFEALRLLRRECVNSHNLPVFEGFVQLLYE